MHFHAYTYLYITPESKGDVQINLFFIAFSENGISHFLYGDFGIGFGRIFTILSTIMFGAGCLLPERIGFRDEKSYIHARFL